MGRLDGKGILISGAARGLGREYACALAREGGKVALIDVDEHVKETVEKIKSNGGTAVHFLGDITRSDEVRAFCEFAYNTVGKIEVLINNAAVYYGLKNKPFTEITEKEWDRVMEVNAKGTWLLCKAVVPYMKKLKKGKIINVATTQVLSGTPGLLHYVASKGAVVGMTRVMARELGQYGIRVNCVAPGLATTEASLGRASQERLKQYAEITALKRVCEPTDLVGVMIFLASDDSDNLTGQTLVSDGGSVFV